MISHKLRPVSRELVDPDYYFILELLTPRASQSGNFHQFSVHQFTSIKAIMSVKPSKSVALGTQSLVRVRIFPGH